MAGDQTPYQPVNDNQRPRREAGEQMDQEGKTSPSRSERKRKARKRQRRDTKH